MPTLKKICVVFSMLGVANLSQLFAQTTPYLEKPVTLSEKQVSFQEIFQIISKQTSVQFSYSRSFNDGTKTSIICKNKPLRLVLSELLYPLGCRYTSKGKYIILKCDSKTSESKIHIRGYIVNEFDSSRIEGASVYIKKLKLASVSNKFGYFDLSMSSSVNTFSLEVAKENYEDTSLNFNSSGKKELMIYIRPLITNTVEKNPGIQDTATSNLPVIIEDTLLRQLPDTPCFWKRFKIKNPNLRNIQDTLFTKVSFSVLPNIGTNNLLSINTVNQFAFNLFGGYSKGIGKFELAGLFNIDNGNVKYVQVGGLTNVVSGSVKGLQIGGLLNSNGKQTKGFQLAGLLNSNQNDFKGVGISGLSNLVMGNVKGLQLSGLLNLSTKKTNGVQISGLMNLSSKRMIGLQFSGLFNYAKKIKGSQIAGVANYTDTLTGIQLSSIYNHARVSKGMQIGFINYADTSSGLTLGFLSFVKKGYHKLEIALDETRFINFSFATGVPKFHNLIHAGVYAGDRSFWTYGYGLGSNLRLSKRWNLNMSLLAQQIQEFEPDRITLNNLNRFFLGPELKISSKVTLGLGPQLYLFIRDRSNPNYDSFYKNLSSYSIDDSYSGSYHSSIWLGGKVFLKFF